MKLRFPKPIKELASYVKSKKITFSIFLLSLISVFVLLIVVYNYFKTEHISTFLGFEVLDGLGGFQLEVNAIIHSGLTLDGFRWVRWLSIRRDDVMNDIEIAVKDAIMDTSPASMAGPLSSRTERTRLIKDALNTLAPKFSFLSVDGEWLYDICWYKSSRGEAGNLIRLALVAECEWSPDPEMDGDFQKLVQARADLRVWVFQVGSQQAVEQYFAACKQQVCDFEGTLAGDRYLLAGFDWAQQQFFFEHFVAPQCGTDA